MQLPTPAQSSRCKVCQHPYRHAIELSIVRGVSYRENAKRYSTNQYKLTAKNVHSHGQKHMPRELRAALLMGANNVTAQELAELHQSESEGLLVSLAAQRGHLWSDIHAAETLRNFAAAASLHKQLIGVHTLTAKLVGQLSDGTQITNNNLVISPEYLQLRHALMRALQRHPEARADVLKALREIEDVKTAPAAIEREPMKTIEAAE